MKTETKQVAVAVRGIHKEFVLPQHKRGSVKQAFVNIVRRNGKTIQKVLDGVNFEVYEGEFFGVVGRNGSGKSTLLKLLAGVYAPTSGEVAIHGSLTPFIELGVGFNPELTGRDNVFLNGALLGFSRKEMEAMYDEIVEFAEIAPFMDQKLKNYSSGMQVRLAFSIAIKAHGDVLVFDEVLAVGDEAFQRKCLDVFERYKAEGQTVILVTHDMEIVRQFCSRALLINEGKIVELGDPQVVADVYSQLNQIAIDAAVALRGSGRSQFLNAQILGGNSKPQQSFNIAEKMRLVVTWNGLAAENVESIGVNIFKQSGEHVTGVNTRYSSHARGWKEKASIEVEFELNIAPGTYYILVEAFEEEGKLIDALHNGPGFSVIGNRVIWSGLTNLPHKWLG